jgi:hypothetical protein
MDRILSWHLKYTVWMTDNQIIEIGYKYLEDMREEKYSP